MTLIHLLLLVLVSGIVIMAVLLVKKIRDLRLAPDVEDLHMELRGMEKSLRQHEDQLRKSIQTMVRVRPSRTI